MSWKSELSHSVLFENYPSFYKISIVYELIGSPLSIAGGKLIITLRPMVVVVTCSGADGRVDASIDVISENGPNP